MPALGDGMNVEARDDGQASVTTMSELARFIAGQQSLLLLIECT